jgi:hypothetical protein
VYVVEPLGCDGVLAGYDWDLSRIDGIEGGRGSPVPKRGIVLSEFMKGAVLKGESR